MLRYLNCWFSFMHTPNDNLLLIFQHIFMSRQGKQSSVVNFDVISVLLG